MFKIHYVCSMPWPTDIASNLMIGCWSRVEDTKFKLDPHELEAARWFSKEEIKSLLNTESHQDNTQPATGYVLPGPYTTAHKLLTHWINN